MSEGGSLPPSVPHQKQHTMTHTFTVSRTYETIVEIEADNYVDALIKFADTDIYPIELEQCCVTEEFITSDHGEVDDALLSFVKKHSLNLTK